MFISSDKYSSGVDLDQHEVDALFECLNILRVLNRPCPAYSSLQSKIISILEVSDND